MNGNLRRSVKLGDLFTIKHGYAFKGEHFGTEGSHIVLTPGNFFDEGGFKKKGDKEKWYSGKIPEDYILSRGDLIVAMTEQGEGLLGSTAIVPESSRYLHNQRLGLIQTLIDVNKRFLYYLFNSHSVRQQIRASCSGVKVRHTSPSRIYDVKVDIPTLPTQRKIAAVLSAYDDLIENNLRRIKILEEMAQNLYREWFVKFRFPGYQHARFVDSPLGRIPEGWEVKRQGEILELNYGKALKKEDRHEGKVPVYGSSGVVGYHNTPLVKGPGIIVGRKGNVGSVYWTDEDFYPIDTVYFVASKMPLRFLFYDLQTKNFLNNDAAVPGLNRNQAYSLETVIPPLDMLTQFCIFADGFEQQAAVLRLQNTTLRRTRDLLLPKLISGEVDVSELDITIPEEVAA